jgi:hypothetical protein
LTAAAAILTTSNTNATAEEDDNDNHDPLYIPDSDDDILVISEDKRDDFSEEEIEEPNVPHLISSRINKSHMKQNEVMFQKRMQLLQQLHESQIANLSKFCHSEVEKRRRCKSRKTETLK